jgi:hypothetical protein
MANWIGCGSISRENKSLAPAAAEIDFAPIATAAGLLHPGGASKCLECWRIRPDIGKRMVLHPPEIETWDHFSGVARQHLARGCHIE